MTEQQMRKRRRMVLAYLYLLSAGWGAYSAFVTEPIETDSAMRLAGCLWVAMALATQLGFMWFCTLDARLVGKPLPQLARIGVFLAWPLAVPVYLLWARRIRGLATLLVHGFGLLVVFAATALTVAYMHLGPEWYV